MYAQKTISSLIEGATKELKLQNYSKESLRFYTVIWNQLKLYAAPKGITCFSTEFGYNFLEQHYGFVPVEKLDRNSAMRIRAINVLSDYQLHGTVLIKKCIRNYEFPECFRTIISEFISYRNSLKIVKKSMQTAQLYLERFIFYLTRCEITDLSQVETYHINGFVNTIAIYSKPTMAGMLRHVRHLFGFAYQRGYVTSDLTHKIPVIKYNRESKIPSAYSTEEVNRLIQCIDRGNPAGKRDYAIILLAARLGIRASDIHSLCFTNINWEINCIELIQQKTGNPLSLPLLEDVGEAIIDYLKYGRPDTSAHEIFVRHKAPFGQLTSTGIYQLVSKYIQKAGIPVPHGKKHGPHALRHSLAGKLLENNIPLPVISEILGHADSKTTTVYLKIDVSHLRQCALEVPFIGGAVI